MGRCTEMRELGKNAGASSLKEVSADLERMVQAYEQARDSVAAIADSQGDGHTQWHAAGLAEPGFLHFVHGLQQEINDQRRLVASLTVSQAKKAIADALALLGALPSDLKDGEGEHAFRSTMSKNALLVIQIFDSIAASAKALQDLPADQDGVDIVALIQHAARLGPLLEFHVCFYTALTLFRSPQMSDAGGALKAKLYGNLQVALTKISRLRFADGSGPPKHAEALLSEMCAFAALLICRRPDAFVPSSCCVCVCVSSLLEASCLACLRVPLTGARP